METQRTVTVETTTRIYFSEDDIADILFREAGIEKTFMDSCEWDYGQIFRGATLTIKRTENSETSSLAELAKE